MSGSGSCSGVGDRGMSGRVVPGVRDRAGSVTAWPAGLAGGPRLLGRPGGGAGSATAAVCC
jgi:hypothetical protein